MRNDIRSKPASFTSCATGCAGRAHGSTRASGTIPRCQATATRCVAGCDRRRTVYRQRAMPGGSHRGGGGDSRSTDASSPATRRPHPARARRERFSSEKPPPLTALSAGTDTRDACPTVDSRRAGNRKVASGLPSATALASASVNPTAPGNTLHSVSISRFFRATTAIRVPGPISRCVRRRLATSSRQRIGEHLWPPRRSDNEPFSR